MKNKYIVFVKKKKLYSLNKKLYCIFCVCYDKYGTFPMPK